MLRSVGRLAFEHRCARPSHPPAGPTAPRYARFIPIQVAARTARSDLALLEISVVRALEHPDRVVVSAEHQASQSTRARDPPPRAELRSSARENAS